MLLGCIGDDFTGSSDIANTLAKQGMSVMQYNGVPAHKADESVEAGVVSLKSRTEPVEAAVRHSIEAAEWLLNQGCEQLFFKYCSTFDSTPYGNIGPVADALAKLTGETRVLFCPAFPTTGRTVYQGNLFVNDVPLHESGMKDHPLTPMTDSDLRRWLGHQTDVPIKHLCFATVNAGTEAVLKAIEEAGEGYFVADAVTDQHLVTLGAAAAKRLLLTGGSGLALGLPGNYRTQGKLGNTISGWKGNKGSAVVLSGSCSEATRQQIKVFARDYPTMELSADEIFRGIHTPMSVGDWVLAQDKSPLVYTSADPSTVLAAQQKFGREKIASKIEQLFGQLALYLSQAGVGRIVSAGGETSGAIVTALKVNAMQIGPEIAAGVPALRIPDQDLTLALKSGNFGGEHFFAEALEVLQQDIT